MALRLKTIFTQQTQQNMKGNMTDINLIFNVNFLGELRKKFQKVIEKKMRPS